VTPLVQDWVSGRLANNGLMLISADTTQHGQWTITSREHGYPAQLVVQFVPAPRERQTTLHLVQGLNMISLPLLPDDLRIESVLAGVADRVMRVWTYESTDTSNPWRLYEPGSLYNDLITLAPQRGYWIEMSAPADLNLSGANYSQMTIPLHAGWNFVGYPASGEQIVTAALNALPPQVDLVWYYDASDPVHPWRKYSTAAPAWASNLTELQSGRGYWMRAQEECTLVLP
jgi:hypothetical protein